jgi:hypothetical protein
MHSARRSNRAYALELSLDDNQLDLLTDEKGERFFLYFLQKEDFFFILGCLLEFSSF